VSIAQAPADRFALARPASRGACRLLADGVDIRIIQLMLGHASVQQTQRDLNVTDDELRKGLEVSWKRRTLKVVGGQKA
jgi:integrase